MTGYIIACGIRYRFRVMRIDKNSCQYVLTRKVVNDIVGMTRKVVIPAFIVRKIIGGCVKHIFVFVRKKPFVQMLYDAEEIWGAI